MSNVIALQIPSNAVTITEPTKPTPSTRRRLKTIGKYSAKLQRKHAQWTKSEIGGLTKMLNSIRFDSGRRPEEITEALYDLQGLCASDYGSAQFSHRITEEQSAFGIEWLRRAMITKRGQPSAMLKRAADGREETIMHVIQTFKEFRFIGVLIHRSPYGMEFHTPIYRTIARDGSYFDYSPAHWNDPTILRSQRKGA